jgi:hypothetical protein
VLRDEGVLAPLSFHTAVYLNGKFYGLFGIIEKVRVRPNSSSYSGAALTEQ